jgi:A/G-specific adenine glycosylase
VPESDIKTFVAKVLAYHTEHGRHSLPWRLTSDPYAILVSELMLQQTQVDRVVPKFRAFMERFPTAASLAEAPQKDVLIMWQGLGYNRRARYVHQAAQMLTERGQTLSDMKHELTTLPGIGPYTAGAVRAFAFNAQEVFLETNIRTVFIHHFFADAAKVPDDALIPLVAQCLPHVREPRVWYAALMDYGSHLKKTIGNVSRRSASYTKQKPFARSPRAVRGAVLKLLAKQPMSDVRLKRAISHYPPEQRAGVLEALCAERLIHKTGTMYHL